MPWATGAQGVIGGIFSLSFLLSSGYWHAYVPSLSVLPLFSYVLLCVCLSLISCLSLIRTHAILVYVLLKRALRTHAMAGRVHPGKLA